MADTITTNSEVNVLQSFSDATAGRSQQLFWVVFTETGGILTRDQGASSKIAQVEGVDDDEDYDITINKPTIIAGLATMDLTLQTASAGIGATAAVAVYIKHYDGTTETTLGTMTASISSNEELTKILKIKCDVTRKMFGVGHTLRVNVVITDGTQCTATMYTDPNTAGHECKIWIPVVNLE